MTAPNYKILNNPAESRRPVLRRVFRRVKPRCVRPALLLRHLYFLNTIGYSKNKILSVGFDPDFEFKVTILIDEIDSNTNFFVGDGSDWMLFMMGFGKIHTYYGSCEKERENFDVLFTSANVKVVRSKTDSNQIIFKNINGRYKGRSISISKCEFDAMCDIREFIMEVVNHYRKVMFAVYEYYNCYIYKTITLSKDRLDCTQMFKPSNFEHCGFDYIRLFYEIPVIAPKKADFVYEN